MIFADLDISIAADFDFIVSIDQAVMVLVDVLQKVVFVVHVRVFDYFNVEFALDFGVLVAVDQVLLILFDDEVPIGSDPFAGFFLGALVLIALGVEEDLFERNLVFIAEFVVVRWACRTTCCAISRC